MSIAIESKESSRCGVGGAIKSPKMLQNSLSASDEPEKKCIQKKKCSAGCITKSYRKLHAFPSTVWEPKRREDWLKLLGVKSHGKHLFACEDHFSPQMMRGTRLRNDALPDLNLSNFCKSKANREDILGGIAHDHTYWEVSLPSECGSSQETATERGLAHDHCYWQSPLASVSGKFFESPSFLPTNEVSSLIGCSGETSAVSGDTRNSQKLCHKMVQTVERPGFTSLELDLLKKIACFKQREAEWIKQLAEKDLKIAQLNKTLEISNMPQSTMDNSIEDICKKLPMAVAACVRNILRNNGRSKNGRRYDDYWKTIALGVLFVSPMTYQMLRGSFGFPHKDTLREFVAEWPRQPGCSMRNLKALELRARGFTEEQKFVAIVCDEMSLHRNLLYDRHNDKIVGLEDYGDENRTSRIANFVNVVMVQGICGLPWRQPYAYFFVRGACPGLTLKKYVLQIIGEIQGIGLHPCAFVCDQGKNFLSLAASLDVRESHPYFTVNEEDVMFFYDSPHLLKSTRNCLQNKRNVVHFNGKRVSWNDIEYFYNIDSQNPIRCAPKLTAAHIKTNTFQKMRVSLAAQTLSNTVASGMNTLYSSPLFDRSKAPTTPNTVELVSFFDRFYDFFNSSGRTNVGSKRVFRGDDTQMQFLQEATTLLKTIKVEELGQDKTNKFSYIKGWILNICSLQHLFRRLSSQGISHLQTRNLCSDSIEHFFGQIRRGAGNAHTITAHQFSGLFQKRWSLYYLKSVARGNCEPLWDLKEVEGEVIHTVCNDSLVRDQSWQDFQSLPRPELSIIQSIPIDIQFEEVEFLRKNAFVYVCGWLYKKLSKLHQCLNPLTPFGDVPVSSEYLFTLEKQYENCNLVQPPEEFVANMSQLEEQFCSFFNGACHRVGLSQFLFSKMAESNSFVCCSNYSCDSLVQLFIRVRIHFALKFFNRELADPNFDRKILTIKHL